MGVARLGSAFLGRVCALEQQLFESWFACGENDAPLEEGDSLGDMLFELCSTMYNYLRPFLIHEVELDVLCQLIAVIQEEAAALGVGGTAAEGQSTTGKIIGSVLSRLVQDAQERLIFCSITLIRDEVEQYAPTSLDLDYPQRLAATAKVANGNGGASADAAAADAPPSEQGELFASWYAPLRSTLMILSKIYRAVDIIVFEDLAQQAVGACLEALQRAAQMITTNKGAVDGDLFLVKHLLVLREQLTPFDISLSATKRRLDFAPTRGAFSRFVADRHNLFRWSAENAQAPRSPPVRAALRAAPRWNPDLGLLLFHQAAGGCEGLGSKSRHPRGERGGEPYQDVVQVSPENHRSFGFFRRVVLLLHQG